MRKRPQLSRRHALALHFLTNISLDGKRSADAVRDELGQSVAVRKNDDAAVVEPPSAAVAEVANVAVVADAAPSTNCDASSSNLDSGSVEELRATSVSSRTRAAVLSRTRSFSKRGVEHLLDPNYRRRRRRHKSNSTSGSMESNPDTASAQFMQHVSAGTARVNLVCRGGGARLDTLDRQRLMFTTARHTPFVVLSVIAYSRFAQYGKVA